MGERKRGKKIGKNIKMGRILKKKFKGGGGKIFLSGHNIYP